MLVDTRTTNYFMTLKCAKKLGVVVENTALPVKMNFVQGSYQVTQVARSVRFKASALNFEEDFTIHELDGCLHGRKSKPQLAHLHWSEMF